jgi:hypothetical protein
MASLSVETFSPVTRQRVSGPDDISLPSVSHRDVEVHPEVFFASGRSGGWYAQTKNGERCLRLDGRILEVHQCVRLPAGEVIELRAQGGIGEPAWSVVLWRAVLTERPAATLVQWSGPSLFNALSDDALFTIIGHLGGHSTSTYALAATCRENRAAVERWLAPQIDKTQRERSLWQLVGERWPLSVLRAKLDASPTVCEQQLVEMLSSGPAASMKRLSGFPFAAHITKGESPPSVPAGLLLEKASPDALALLCVRIPAAAAGLKAIEMELSGLVKWNLEQNNFANAPELLQLRAVRDVQLALRDRRLRARLHRRE